MPIPLPSLAGLAPSALTARLYEIRGGERALLVEMLAYLGEVDRRKLYLDLGFSSLFAFLTDYLGYVKSSAYRRSTAARLMARFPLVADYLADGRLCLTTLVELRDVLDERSLISILDRAAGRTEDQVRELVAALRPRPEPIDLLRRLPAARPSSPALPGSGREPTAQLPLLTPATPATPTTPASPATTPATPATLAALATPTTPGPPADRTPARPTITPISEERRVLRVTVGRAFVADLEAVKAALSHQVPDGDLETVLHECVRRTLTTLTRRRHGTARARPPATPTHGRHIPAAVRNEVFRRDDGRCTFVGLDGHRCGSMHQIEIHHLHPFALGGAATVANLALMCARHNRYIAEKELAA